MWLLDTGFNKNEMHCEGILKLRSRNTSCCLIEVVTKAGLTVLDTKKLIKVYD